MVRTSTPSDRAAGVSFSAPVVVEADVVSDVVAVAAAGGGHALKSGFLAYTFQRFDRGSVATEDGSGKTAYAIEHVNDGGRA